VPPKHPILAACVGLSLLCIAASSQAETPLPTRQARSVYDVAGVISAGHEQQMEVFHTELFKKTGVAIVIVTVSELENETIAELAVRIGHQWGVGRKGEDRGISIAFSLKDRKMFIATGYGVEGYLPDGRVGELRDQVAMPHLRRNDFSTGLFQLSTALVAASATEYGANITGVQKLRRTSRRSRRGVNPILLILGALGFLYMAIKHPRLLLLLMLTSGRGGFGGRGGGGFGGGGGGGGFGGGGFGGGGAGGGF
jgi:uncharacterized protein